MANIATKSVSWALSKVANSSPYRKIAYNKVNKKTLEQAVAYATIGSIVFKDGVGCGMYVYQSINNEKIPEKRRKFVASLDATNGLLMIASQIIMFFAMRKINDKMFHGIFKSFDKEGSAFNRMAKIVRSIEKSLGQKVDKKLTLKKEYMDMRDVAYALFKSVTELAAATIVAKRVIVPFIATPLAQKLEKWMDKREAKKQGITPDTKTEDKSNPPMTGAKKAQVSNQISQPWENNNSTNLLDKFKN